MFVAEIYSDDVWSQPTIFRLIPFDDKRTINLLRNPTPAKFISRRLIIFLHSAMKELFQLWAVWSSKKTDGSIEVLLLLDDALCCSAKVNFCTDAFSLAENDSARQYPDAVPQIIGWVSKAFLGKLIALTFCQGDATAFEEHEPLRSQWNRHELSGRVHTWSGEAQKEASNFLAKWSLSKEHASISEVPEGSASKALMLRTFNASRSMFSLGSSSFILEPGCHNKSSTRSDFA